MGVKEESSEARAALGSLGQVSNTQTCHDPECGTDSMPTRHPVGEPALARQLDKAPYKANEDLGPEEVDGGREENPGSWNHV